MQILTYLTDNCRQTAKKHGFSSEIKNLLHKVEADQSVQAWDYYPAPFLKKDLGRSFRLLAAKQPLPKQDVVVICFLAVCAHGREYERFVNQPNQVARAWLPNPAVLEAWLAEHREDLPAPRPQPDPMERQFLYDDLVQDWRADMMVYESAEWVEAMKERGVVEKHTRLYDLLLKLVQQPEKASDTGVVEDTTYNVAIHYCWLPAQKSYFLIAPQIRRQNGPSAHLIQKYAHLNAAEALSEQEVLQCSRRSYPALILAGEEQIWKDIQQDGVGNIALSPEESRILEAVTRRQEEALFPLFINGRPGSGKSTILQYLFASWLQLYLKSYRNCSNLAPPLYLTCSDMLLDAARRNVRNIITCNYRMLLDTGDNQVTPVVLADVEKECFGIFHDFLRKLLPPAQQEQFPPELQIRFPEFRDRWDARRRQDPSSEVRNLTPELAWHVLRTYIKGMRYEPRQEFDLEAYRDLPRNQQTVQAETFRRVYQHVWRNWYQGECRDNGFWDDQDLVAAVIAAPPPELGRWPAIFCDEAQDFSKLELDLILRLSLYAGRSLPAHELKRVPFCFAGDPLQTLNPTGFDWEALQARFHEKIVAGLDVASAGKLLFNYQELSRNYRSGRFIVGFCNLLQLLRGILFQEKDLKPQHNWFDLDAGMPVFFNLKDPLCEKELREQSETVIILPCQEGEEKAFVQQDDFLRRLATSETDIRNYLSPIRAKGLEFSRVVLYGFGRACVRDYPNLFQPLGTDTGHAVDDDTVLPLKYFMNRLYVAASRAKSRLIIVDDDAGIAYLWDNAHLKSMENLRTIYQPSSRHVWQTETVNYVQRGVAENWRQDRDDPLELAHSFREAGLLERDAYKLLLAEHNYLRCGQKLINNAKLCRAERLEIEKKFSEAGKQYLELDRIDAALNCLWTAGELTLIAATRQFDRFPEQRGARYYTGARDAVESLNFLQFLQSQLTGPLRPKLRSAQWRRVLDACLTALLQHVRTAVATKRQSDTTPGYVPPDIDSDIDIDEVYSGIQALAAAGIHPSDPWQMAALAFLAQDYEQAVRLWESRPASPNHLADYNAAKARTTGYPENLIWYEKIQGVQEIIAAWQAHPQVPLDSPSARVVYEALENASSPQMLLWFLQQHPQIALLRRAVKHFDTQEAPFPRSCVRQLLILSLAREEKWHEMPALFLDKPPDASIQEACTRVLVYAIAQSRTLDSKIALANLLKQLLIDTPWTGGVPMRVAGAAIERAGKFIDALEFYELVWRKRAIAAQPGEVAYAISRWVKSKLDLANMLKMDSDARKQATAEKHFAEAEGVCRTHLKIHKEKIALYPEFEEINLEQELRAAIELSSQSDSSLSSDQQTLILHSHRIGRTPAEIAAFLGLDSNAVQQVLRIHSV